MKKTLVSGIQSSGKLHIGNYFGAIKPNIELGNSGEYESYIFIADYHSMTTLTNREERMQNTFEAACVYLALGLDPEKVAFFKQSDRREHTELTWILNSVTPMPILMLAHAFKDSEAKNKDVNIGLFDYPVLMAADILIYKGDLVPVGRDQEQHIEIAREIAGKFNRCYAEIFPMPQAYIKKEVATIPGTDGAKMSKSKNNHIPIFAEPEELRKKILSIVTDSASPLEKKDPDASNIYQIHKLFLADDEDKELRDKFESGGYGYKEAKEDLLKTFTTWREPFQEKYQKFYSNKQLVYDILNSGSEKAKTKARQTIDNVRSITGLEFN